MRTPVLTILVAFLGSACVASSTARAVCLDPKTYLSGYHVPLAEELSSSYAIIVGQVLEQHAVIDPTDPDNVIASIYTVHALKTLKGQVPQTITLRAENDSGRYPMSMGETHLLFLSKLESGLGADYYADSCGSSSLLPKGNAILRQVETQLHWRRHAL